MGTSIITQQNDPNAFVALREDALTPDANDPKRLEFNKRSWSRYDDLLRNYHRQVEENVRMLAGQQHSVYNPVLQRWLNVEDWMRPDELRWKQRPVFNRLLPWYIITHARATENPPIVTFAPGPDRSDAELAEVMDIAFKALWREMGMDDQHDRLMGWVICAGRGHLMTRVDYNRGPIRKWIGQADLPMMEYYDGETDEEGNPAMGPQVDPNTGQPILAQGVPDIPHDAQGQPLAHITPEGQVQITGAPHEEREGVLRCDVLSPLQVRGSWGGGIPWYDKRIHIIRTYQTPEEVYEMTGVDVAPDVRGSGVQDVSELERILYGTGFYGSMDGIPGAQAQPVSTEGYVELTTRWEAPVSRRTGMEETADSPGGRLTVSSQQKVLYDGPRPAKFPYTSPLSTFEFVRLPGRPQGATPQEALNPVQRGINDGIGRVKEHVNLSTNPKGVIDQATGIKAGQFTNAPGDNYVVVRRPGVPAIEFVAPPPLGQDVYKFQEILLGEFDVIGQLPSTKGDIPRDASGELVKELRFDDDRFLGPTVRRAASEYGRFVENLRAWLPIVWDEQKILAYTGDDNVARTIVVMPQIFEQGKINVVPDVESMLPEGRGERARNVLSLYDRGALGGPPGTPQSTKMLLDLVNFPHLSRIAKFGGVDRTTAEQENGQLVQGANPQMIPVFEWYDHAIHLMIHESFMKSPEFKKVAPQVQEAFVFHRQAHMMALAQQQMKMAMQQASMNQIANPQPEGGEAGGGGGKPSGAGSSPKTPPSPEHSLLGKGTPEPPKSLGGGRMPTQLPANSPV
jgi:hypothetical protein